jgi:Protein of unknown function (DUF2716)
MMEGFRACLGTGHVVYGMSWHHFTHVTDPHELDFTKDPLEWPVMVLPFGNYEILVSERFDMGMFSHPWEKSICVFGSCLIEQVKSSRSVLEQCGILRQQRLSEFG